MKIWMNPLKSSLKDFERGDSKDEMLDYKEVEIEGNL
tara:strand:+ start:597 stop:707 length:111 start_codon:yes stop_codon:yes gene_type:complete